MAFEKMITVIKMTKVDDEGKALKAEWYWMPAQDMDMDIDFKGPFNTEEEADEDAIKTGY